MPFAARLRIAALLAALAALAPAAHAQIFRAYVAPTGSDANPCTLPLPCRLLPAALTAVRAGGEVWMLDSANYNTATVTIDKSVHILAVPGVVGSVVATGGPAISIIATDATVSLRNLVIAPLGVTGTHGVSVTGRARVDIEHCVITGIFADGIFIDASEHSPGNVRVNVSGTTIRNSGNHGISVLNDAVLTVERSTIVGSHVSGVLAYATGLNKVARASITDTTISGDVFYSGFGVWAFTSGDATAEARMEVSRTTITNVGMALRSEGALGVPRIRVGSSVLSGLQAWNTSGSAARIASFGNNQMTAAGGGFTELEAVTLQ